MQRKPRRKASRTGLKSITITYPLQNPSSGYRRDRPESMSCLTNQTPVRNKRPVNKETAPNQIFLRNRSPITTVEAIVTVIAHREVAVFWHRQLSLGKVQPALRLLLFFL